MYCLTATDRHAVITDGVARYITPVEAERMQGLPDNYTQIPYDGKPARQCPDRPRYKAIGNSFAVPLLGWIAEGITVVDPMPERRLIDLLDPEDLAKDLGDSELLEKCAEGIRKLKDVLPYLREARYRFSQPGRRIPVAGNPTWTEWVEKHLGVGVRRVQQLLRESLEPSETISLGSRKWTRTLRTGDWRTLIKLTEGRASQVFGPIADQKELALAIQKFAQAIADRYAGQHGRIAVSVALKSTHL